MVGSWRQVWAGRTACFPPPTGERSSALADRFPVDLHPPAVRVQALERDVARLVPALEDLHAVGLHPAQQLAHGLGGGEPEPEVQKARELVGWVALVQGQVEPFLVADDDGPVRVPAGAGRVEPGVSLVEAQAAPLVANQQNEMQQAHGDANLRWSARWAIPYPPAGRPRCRSRSCAERTDPASTPDAWMPSTRPVELRGRQWRVRRRPRAA